jgi:hypothetical protein
MDRKDEAERERIRQWIECWKVAAPVLEQERFEQVRRTDTAEAIMQLSDAFEWARRSYPPSSSSGLVEQQALFHRLPLE